MTNQQSNKGMNIVLWIVQVLLGGMFIMAGGMKAAQPIEALTEMLPWVTTVPAALVKFIGVSEVLGGIGLLLPSLLRIKPSLTVTAAYALILVMILAALFHGLRGEFPAIGTNVVLIAMAYFIAWGRSKKAPIAAK